MIEPTSAPGERRVFRPARARVVVYGCAGGVFLAMLLLAINLPSTGPHRWGLESRLGVVAVGVVVVLVLHRLAGVRVETSGAGVRVVNVFGRRRLEWAEIVGVRLLQDDAWMMLDLSDGEALAAMGVQRSEGARGQRQARDFARLVNEHTRVPGHD
jgi:hypothetical protein